MSIDSYDDAERFIERHKSERSYSDYPPKAEKYEGGGFFFSHSDREVTVTTPNGKEVIHNIDVVVFTKSGGDKIDEVQCSRRSVVATSDIKQFTLEKEGTDLYVR